MNREDVIDVLSAVAAATRRTVGQLDVEIWQGVIGDLPKDLALRAVRDHLRECPGVWLEPGHIAQRVRAIVRDQLEREPDTAREARQLALESKVLQDAEDLAAEKAIPHEKFVRRTIPALKVKCPWCHAAPGLHCHVPQTNARPHGGAHPSRIELASAQ